MFFRWTEACRYLLPSDCLTVTAHLKIFLNNALLSPPPLSFPPPLPLNSLRNSPRLVADCVNVSGLRGNQSLLRQFWNMAACLKWKNALSEQSDCFRYSSLVTEPNFQDRNIITEARGYHRRTVRERII